MAWGGSKEEMCSIVRYCWKLLDMRARYIVIYMYVWVVLRTPNHIRPGFTLQRYNTGSLTAVHICVYAVLMLDPI